MKIGIRMPGWGTQIIEGASVDEVRVQLEVKYPNLNGLIEVWEHHRSSLTPEEIAAQEDEETQG